MYQIYPAVVMQYSPNQKMMIKSSVLMIQTHKGSHPPPIYFAPSGTHHGSHLINHRSASVRISLMSFTGLSLVSTSQLFNTSLGSQRKTQLFGMQKPKSRDFAVHSGIAKKASSSERRWNRLFTNRVPTKFALLLLFLAPSLPNQWPKMPLFGNLRDSALHRICKPPTTRPNLAIAMSKGPSLWILSMKKDSHWSQMSLFAISIVLYP